MLNKWIDKQNIICFLNYSKSLWEICSENKIPFIYASSAATYGLGEFGFEDNHQVVEQLKPLNPYGDSKNDFDKCFEGVDAILTPSTPSSAFKIGEKSNDPISMYLNDIFTVPVNLAGIPAISIPAGQDNKGYPLGLQLISKSLDEQKILNIAFTMEKSIGFEQYLNRWWE